MARVRIVPGTGQWVINGRTLEDYFPNRVHQQIVNEPFKAVDAEGLYDVVANLTGGGVGGQSGRAASRHRSFAQRDRRRSQPSVAEEGRIPDSRSACQGTQEVRPQEGP